MFTTFTSKQILVLVVPVCILSIFLYFFYIPLNPISQNLKKKKTVIEPFCPHGNKLILFWTKYFEVDDFYFGFGPKPFQECEVATCCTTRNRSRLDESDGVIFHIRDLNLQDLPSHRLTNQRWIFFLLESPHHTPYILKNLGNIFNWTMTYRIDSDIYTPYPVMSIDEINQKPVIESQTKNTTSYDLRSMVQKKKKLVAWFVSNCKTPSAREKYVAELQKYVQVDVYGECGPFKCLRRMECYIMMERDYKFYLAFENSVCQDYVTEKFYNALLFKTVPIVYGGANYSAVAPKMSYINVRDFQSVKHLAEYLKFLDGNDDAYKRYFDWRQTPPGLSLLPHGLDSWCSLCNMLHNDSLPTRTYSNIHSWWFEKGGCEKDRTQPFT